MTYKVNEKDVSLSFHYIKRTKKKKKKDGSDELVSDPFDVNDFENLHKSLKAQKKKSVKDKTFQHHLRIGSQCTVQELDAEERFISGIYGKSYSGHEFENSVHGTITAESLNIRPFFFLLYLSEKGEIYMASQYLGNYGGYAVLKDTIYYLLGGGANLNTISFNTNKAFASYAVPTEVEIQYSKKSEKIEKGSSYKRAGVIGFKKSDNAEDFSKEVKKDFLSLLSKSESNRKKAIAEVISTELNEFVEEDIDDCKIIAKVSKKTRTIQIFDRVDIASRFPVDIQVGKSGHPPYKAMKEKAKEILKSEIMAVKTDD